MSEECQRSADCRVASSPEFSTTLPSPRCAGWAWRGTTCTSCSWESYRAPGRISWGRLHWLRGVNQGTLILQSYAGLQWDPHSPPPQAVIVMVIINYRLMIVQSSINCSIIISTNISRCDPLPAPLTQRHQANHHGCLINGIAKVVLTKSFIGGASHYSQTMACRKPCPWNALSLRTFDAPATRKLVRGLSDVATTDVCKMDSKYWNTIVRKAIG